MAPTEAYDPSWVFFETPWGPPRPPVVVEVASWSFHLPLPSGISDNLNSRFAEALRRDPCPFCNAIDHHQLDHVVPRSQGGADTFDNLAGVCASCNREKGIKSLLAFLLGGAA